MFLQKELGDMRLFRRFLPRRDFKTGFVQEISERIHGLTRFMFRILLQVNHMIISFQEAMWTR